MTGGFETNPELHKIHISEERDHGRISGQGTHHRRSGFNRWLVPPAALCIHLCIGMAYGFSVFWLPLTKCAHRRITEFSRRVRQT